MYRKRFQIKGEIWNINDKLFCKFLNDDKLTLLKRKYWVNTAYKIDNHLRKALINVKCGA